MATVPEPAAAWRRATAAALASLSLLASACGPGQRMARLGDLTLSSGEIVRNCELGYRTFGRLDPNGSNAVLLLPWFMGRSADVARQVGPGKLVDSSRYYVIVVDALGNGVSTSPSNSLTQPGPRFPRYTLRDIVAAQRRLLGELGIAHLHAVVGISMGGTEVFEWITAHPGFMDRAVSIVGSPRVPNEERQQWLAQVRRIRTTPRLRRVLSALARGEPGGALAAARVDADDYALQAEALRSADISSSFGGSLDRAVASIRAQTLVVVSQRDEVVDPRPAAALARVSGARLLELDGRCGHDAPSCERHTLWPAIARFLAE